MVNSIVVMNDWGSQFPDISCVGAVRFNTRHLLLPCHAYTEL